MVHFALLTHFETYERDLRSYLQFLMPRASNVVWVRFPETPEIVRLNVPRGAVRETDSVSALDEEVGFGENAAVTPLGSPLTEKFTLPAKPPEGVMIIAVWPLLPRRMVSFAGDAEREKLGAGVTVREI